MAFADFVHRAVVFSAAGVTLFLSYVVLHDTFVGVPKIKRDIDVSNLLIPSVVSAKE